MRIGINLCSLKEGRKVTGIENFIIQVLDRILDWDDKNEFFLFSNGPVQFNVPKKRNIKLVISGTKNLFIYSKYVIWQEIAKNKIDVYWTPTSTVPIIKRKKTKYIITIYDLANFRMNNIARYNNLKRRFFLHTTRSSANSSYGIVTISNASKQDIIDEFKTAEDKIKVIYLGGIDTKDESEDTSIIDKYGLNKYFLYVGTLQPRKNIITIVKAFIKLRSSEVDSKLVLVGSVGWGMEEALSLIEQSEYKDDVILTGFISDEEKKALYKNCQAFLFPSLYEGFGIPVLEAFHYGIPVITAKNSSLPEVGGEAALYMNDVMSADELSELMRNVTMYSETDRERIKEKDWKQLNLFSWDKCAKELYEYIVG